MGCTRAESAGRRVTTSYFDLSMGEQKEAMDAAANTSGRLSHLLEKDIWVVWALHQLFTADFGSQLVFKGGTSLSKVHGAIRRFSEDVDVTWDIRHIIPDRIGRTGGEPLPPSSSQAKKWAEAIRERLPRCLSERLVPLLSEESERLGLRVEQMGDKVSIHYRRATDGRPYTEPRVQLEFGARGTGEPWIEHHVVCDAADYLPEIGFPEATVRAMEAERTFWEKATAAHISCIQGTFRGTTHFARHWYDLVQLDACGVADRALADRSLADAVATHKSLFFAEKGPNGAQIDYREAVDGGLQLVPVGGEAFDALRADYDAMTDAGYLPEDAESFEQLVSKCHELTAKANRFS